ncbi:hypothetical protein Gogos_016809 [Gossypium gossypioides]|uniref:RNase H type-1 domain-containing protein n=1 Tax=Gossypium gossypioides TaxID=34282 RepID=A0A7J9B8X6_GOSGO|nr:hypothetical protein [Gossypium gossypioides]
MGCRDRMARCEELNNMITNGELVDLPLVGKKFTWWGVGNGTDVLFWYDVWCNDLPLKNLFLRLFCPAINKMAKVVDYSVNQSFIHDGWRDFFFRPLLDREASLLDDLCDLIKLIVVDPERGVLRNDLGVVLAMFSDPIGSAMPIVAELIAIKMALSLFIQSSRLRGKGLIIESDSAFAVSWCKKKDDPPWKLWVSIIISPGLGHWEGKAARVGLLTAAMAHGSTRIDSAVMFRAWI